jgi:long-chain acyl-CoA synthetase
MAFKDIYESFSEFAERLPNKEAVFYLGSSYSYIKLKEFSERFSTGLHDIGVGEGESMIIYLPNSIQWIVAWLAAIRMGVIAVPITPIYVLRDLEYIANDCGARTIVCLDTNFGYVKQVLGKTSIKRVVVSRITDLLPLFKRFFGWITDQVPRGRVSKGEGIYSFSKLLRKTTYLPVQERIIRKDRIAEILYTGGTTKDPKGVPITHGTFMLGAYEMSADGRKEVISPEDDRTYCSAPLFHILGQMMCLNNILVKGGSLIVDPQVNLDAMFNSIQRHKATSMIGVPTLYRMILEHDRLDQYNLNSLKFCMVGGDALPSELASNWKKRFGNPLYQGYGATETCGGVAQCYAGEDFPEESIGKRLPSREIRVVIPETLEPVPSGSHGELLVSSKEMVRSYWNKPEESAIAFVKMDGKLWYRTSDIVYMDQEGFLYFVDREGDFIKHKGYRISASEIESVLQDHPSVIASAVVGVPDEKVGERIKAFVVLKSDVKGITGYDLIKWCRKELASYKVPHYIEFRDMLPKSKVGKLLKREIRQQERDMLE